MIPVTHTRWPPHECDFPMKRTSEQQVSGAPCHGTLLKSGASLVMHTLQRHAEGSKTHRHADVGVGLVTPELPLVLMDHLHSLQRGHHPAARHIISGCEERSVDLQADCLGPSPSTFSSSFNTASHKQASQLDSNNRLTTSQCPQFGRSG